MNMLSVMRLSRIEAILKSYQMHEDSCPVRQAEKHNALGLSFQPPGECNCWLSGAEDLT